MAAGLIGGLRPGGRSAATRHQAALVVLSIGLLLPLAASGPITFALLLLPAAAAAAPAVATGFARAILLVGPARAGEAVAWCSAALGAGLAVGTVGAGVIADSAGAFVVLVIASALAAAAWLAAHSDRSVHLVEPVPATGGLVGAQQ
jgi:predicted MFS family arabinose efflux permease